MAGAVLDPARGCVETEIESFRLVDVCYSGEDYSAFNYHCLRNLSDQAEVWVADAIILEPASGWERCEADILPEDLRAPPPCFAVDCPLENDLGVRSVPESTCTPEQTREQFACGREEHNWDENCCRRQRCSLDSDELPCGQGEECREVIPAFTFKYCWVWAGDLSACSCATTHGGVPGGFCFAVP